jgi:D-hexose-6-phosphate mutarotase
MDGADHSNAELAQAELRRSVKLETGAGLPSLNARWGRAPGVHFEERYGGAVAVLWAAGSTAIVALQGAQVLSWRRAAHADDVLWLSPVAKLGTGKAVRGGIPVCWPWFGSHPSDATKPAHGFVRAAAWRVAGSAASESRARLVMALDTDGIDPALWPQKARAEIEITVGETLTVSLSTDNLGTAPFALTEALHTYLRVGDIGKVSVSGLGGQSYIDQLDANARRAQGGAIEFRGEVDRIYQETIDDVVVADVSLGREICVSKSGSYSTVVWNPWSEKAEHLGDMGPEGYRQMLCIETANAGDDVVTLASRARHRIKTELSVRPLQSKKV